MTGPAGSGKSALVLLWAHTGRVPGPLAWISCDSGDELPGVFWPCVLEALRHAGVDVTAAGAAPVRGDALDYVFLARLAAGLGTRSTPVVLVLDDFHPAAGSVVAEGVAYLLKQAGAALRLVAVSRRDPPLPLHRSRLVGELAEIRMDDLAFDDRETAALLGQHGVSLSRPSVCALRERTEGWAAGLRLAAMSMAGHRDPEGFVRQFTGDDQAVASYLLEEVLDTQSADMRRLMLATSVPERVNAELATALVGRATGRLFSSMVERNAFFRPLGHGWYRCHQMLVTFLRLRLRHETPGLAGELQRKAATWFSEQGLLTEAVRSAAEAGDWLFASRLIVHQLAIGQALGLTDDRHTAELFRHMPHRVVTRSAARHEPEPALLRAAAALSHGDTAACEEALGHAERALAQLSDADGEHSATIRLTHAVITIQRTRTSDVPAAVKAANAVQVCFGEVSPEMLAARPELKALVLSTRGGDELRGGRLKAAETTLLAGLSAATAVGNTGLRRDCLEDLALLQALRGRFRAAAEFAAKAEHPTLAARSRPDRSGAAVLVAKGWVDLADDRLDAAECELSRAETALQSSPDPFVRAVRALVLSLTSIAEGRRDRALRTLASSREPAPVPWLAQRLDAAEREAHLTRPRPAGGFRTAGDRTRADTEAPQVLGTLSGRELDVLVHLAEMMTTEEIAAELYLSVNTVKTHLKSVYRKLAVTRRTAAVRRAREMRLL
ncbi:LuxR C-terminal-related transcriptional regulator [Streptomyces flavofungini]|uniref:LuxR C-terminal-related transcriptional regulator n=1 Tax=Streptomyces flavofungini TaxID=68200 RepID=UPI001E5A3FE8|nr:LuxR C-terminal-related transcriptional regulator [Streptomyces flavofungini]